MTERKALIRLTRDGGNNWSDWKERHFGEVGDYRKRVVLHRLGRARTASIAVRVSSPVKATILGATAQITPLER